MQRETRIPVHAQAPGEPDGLYDGQDLVFPVDGPDGLEAALTAADGILRHIGGAVTFAALRREIRPGTGAYVTTEVVMRWNSFVPPAQSDNGDVEVEPEAAPAAA